MTKTDPQQAAERPNERPKKDRPQSVEGFSSCRGGLRVENDLLSVRSHELFFSPAPQVASACPTGKDPGQVERGPKQAAGKQAAGRPNTGQKKDARRAFQGVFYATRGC